MCVRHDAHQGAYVAAPQTWEIFGVGGWSHAPGGPQWANKSVLSFHNSVAPKLLPDSKYAVLRKAEAQRLGVVAVVTETGSDQLDVFDDISLSWIHWGYKWYRCGALHPSAGSTPSCPRCIVSRRVRRDVCSRVCSNWTWDSSGLFSTSDNGHATCTDRSNITACLLVDQVQQYSRPYARAIAGELVSFFFNTTTTVAQLTYTTSSSQAVTELFTSEQWHYSPAGYNITVTPSGAVAWKTVQNFVMLTNVVSNVNVTVVLSPK